MAQADEQDARVRQDAPCEVPATPDTQVPMPVVSLPQVFLVGDAAAREVAPDAASSVEVPFPAAPPYPEVLLPRASRGNLVIPIAHDAESDPGDAGVPSGAEPAEGESGGAGHVGAQRALLAVCFLFALESVVLHVSLPAVGLAGALVALLLSVWLRRMGAVSRDALVVAQTLAVVGGVLAALSLAGVLR